MPIHSESSLDTSSIAALYEAAVNAYHASDPDTVQTLAERVLELDSKHTGAMHLHGLLALARNNLQLASQWVNQAIANCPEPAFYNTLYAINLKLGAFNEAVQCLRDGLAQQPNFVPIHYNLSLALQHLGRLEDAAASYRKTLELEPRHSAAHNNLGRLHDDLGQRALAEEHYRRSLELEPGNLHARNNLAMHLLASGRYREAWPYFEDRWISYKLSDGTPAPVRVQAPLPRWNGEAAAVVHGAERSNPLQGERLLVLDEQGYGDSLQFVRYLPLALKRFAQVGYACQPPLRRLYEESLCSRWPGLVLLDPAQVEFDNWTHHCPLMSLPGAFETELTTVPASVPYLHTESERADWWRARLEALADARLPRIGIVWAGGHSGIMIDQQRSIAAARLAPLVSMPHVHWISLQKTDDPDKLPGPDIARHLTDWTDELADFAETAALIANLDLVISVDTSVVHLAAAMGKPVWLLNRFAGCWRWLRDREDSPWYPDVRLFTQSERDDWDTVIARVASALRQRFSL